jgi:cytochrome c oxidase cbb3-type subunit 3
MSSPCLIERILAVGLALGLSVSLAGCGKHPQDVQGAASGYTFPTLMPGGGQGSAPDPRGPLYEGNAAHIARGKVFYAHYNCSGCHFNGGGGIGPALMDDAWTYGGNIDQIRNTILQGRPNGMPSWRGKIPDEQVWEIAAYVKSLSAPPPATTQAGANPPPPAAGQGTPAK